MRKDNTVGIISTIATIFIFIVMTITLICQKGFNQKQIEFNQRVIDLSEASAVPLVFANLDSLTELASPEDHNIFYTVKNVGTTPAFNLRSSCKVDKQKHNPLEFELPDTGVIGDIFPTQERYYAAKKEFKFKGTKDTLYFHVRLDFQDMLDREHYYRATSYILPKSDTVKGSRKPKTGMEWSEFKQLGEK